MIAVADNRRSRKLPAQHLLAIFMHRRGGALIHAVGNPHVELSRRDVVRMRRKNHSEIIEMGAMQRRVARSDIGQQHPGQLVGYMRRGARTGRPRMPQRCRMSPNDPRPVMVEAHVEAVHVILERAAYPGLGTGAPRLDDYAPPQTGGECREPGFVLLHGLTLTHPSAKANGSSARR